MGTFEQKIINEQLKAIKERPEHKRGVEDRILALEQHGVLEITPKRKTPKVLRPVSRKISSNKHITPSPVVPEQVELFRDERGNLVIKEPNE